MAWYAPVRALRLPRTPSERRAYNLAVFDTVWRDVDRYFYDPDFNGVNWEAQRTLFRPLAARAPSDLALYEDVLIPMVARLRSSHVYLEFPPVSRMTLLPDTEPTALRPVSDGKRAQCIVSKDYSFGPGFTTAYAIGEGQIVYTFRKGSSADILGIAPGTRVEGWTVRGTCHEPPTATVQLLLANGERRSLHYSVTPLPPLRIQRVRALASGVRVIRFDTFDAQRIAWLRKQLAEAPAAGVIIDLRFNHGGTYFERVVGALLGPGKLAGRVIGRHWWLTTQVRSTGRAVYSGPVAVLIGPLSASAAEMTADVLHCYHRAVLVGERTAGSVEVGHQFSLPDEGKVMVTVQDYRDPSGRRLEGVGVAPDVFARQTLDAIRGGRDLVVEAAEETLERPFLQHQPRRASALVHAGAP